MSGAADLNCGVTGLSQSCAFVRDESEAVDNNIARGGKKTEVNKTRLWGLGESNGRRGAARAIVRGG